MNAQDAICKNASKLMNTYYATTAILHEVISAFYAFATNGTGINPA